LTAIAAVKMRRRRMTRIEAAGRPMPVMHEDHQCQLGKRKEWGHQLGLAT
jgi:hypothetical protein